MKNLHDSAINWLFANYDVILIGHLQVARIVRTAGVLSTKSRRLLLAFSHGKFRTRLQDAAKRSPVTKVVILVDEAGTSKTCGVCGKENPQLQVYQRHFTCSNPRCQAIIDRDVNGARNIWLSHFGSCRDCPPYYT